MRALSKADLLALTPDRYLAAGFCDEAGAPRAELAGEWATAAANQLLQSELAPQELAFTVEAVRLSLPLHRGAAGARAQTAVSEALETVARMIQQPNNEGLIRWLQDCARFVRAEPDLAAMQAHLDAVLRLYALIAAFASSLPPSSSPERPDPR